MQEPDTVPAKAEWIRTALLFVMLGLLFVPLIVVESFCDSAVKSVHVAAPVYGVLVWLPRLGFLLLWATLASLASRAICRLFGVPVRPFNIWRGF